MDKIAVALEVLRNDELLEEMSKSAGVLRGLGNVLRSVDKAGQGASQFLKSQGHENLAMGARVAPHIASLLGARAVYKSKPVQGAKRKVQAYRYRKAIERAQRGY